MPAISTVLDHVVVVAESLEEGVDYCESILGVRPLKGGEHPRVGTHNYLLNLGAGVFLEVIAINPAAPPIQHPRWFGMDNPAQRKRAAKGPYLATFVARTNDIVAGVAALPMLGPVCPIQRGALQWQITIPGDGDLVEHGAVPSLIQWPENVHPTQSMPDLGCRLVRLEVCHPQPEELAAMWRRIGLHVDDRLRIQTVEAGKSPQLLVHIATPSGTKTLSADSSMPERIDQKQETAGNMRLI